MSEPTNWWDWWVNVAVALGTLGAAGVALFGQAFREKFYPAKLRLALVSPRGERTEERTTFGAGRPVRYYHLRVENERRWSAAHDVQLVLLRCQELGPGDRLHDVWQGDVPFRWRHHELFPLLRTIGHPTDADLCSVSSGGFVVPGENAPREPEPPRLHLHLVLEMNNLPLEYTGPTTRVLTVQARGAETDSPPIRIRVAWDGRWNAGEAEMQRHLIVEEVS